jgi:hypothetical protein
VLIGSVVHLEGSQTVEDATRRNLNSLAQRLKGNGEQVASSSLNIVNQFFGLRETVVEPAIKDLHTQIDQELKSQVVFEYLQTPRGSGWSMAGIRYVVVVGLEDGSDRSRCEIEFTASEGEDYIRVRAARETLPNGPTKEVHLYPRQFTTETVQRVFGTFLVECLESDPDEDTALDSM